MPYAICRVPVSPMREHASHRAEMVSQLLFGEPVELLEAQNDWTKVRAVADQYEGWCQHAQLLAINSFDAASEPQYATDWINPVVENDSLMWVPLGSRVDLIQEAPINTRFLFKGNQRAAVAPDGVQLVELGLRYLNTAYLWGGRSVFGVDCSGFVQQLYRMFGINLPRDAWQQAGEGEAVGFLQEVRAGDLAFFDNAEGRIIHVGILMDAQTILHSAGNVRIDPIDHAGIVHAETGKRTHTLRIIKRYF